MYNYDYIIRLSERRLIMKSDLAELRKKMYLSVNKLSSLTGIPRTAIMRIEQGKVKEISLDYIQILCKFFNVGIERIIRFEFDNIAVA